MHISTTTTPDQRHAAIRQWIVLIASSAFLLFRCGPLTLAAVYGSLALLGTSLLGVAWLCREIDPRAWKSMSANRRWNVFLVVLAVALPSATVFAMRPDSRIMMTLFYLISTAMGSAIMAYLRFFRPRSRKLNTVEV